MKKIVLILNIVLSIILLSCVNNDPNKKQNMDIQDDNIIQSNNITFNYPIFEEVYVPIYSDIYNHKRDYQVALTATLSIRNTSSSDTLFVQKVDYYNTNGELVRKYLEDAIFLRPLETIEYVIEKEDNEGGSGANFLINWGANKKIKPLFQSVMIGEIGNLSFAFKTDGITTNSN